MKVTFLTLACTLCVSPLFIPTASAQQQADDRYEERKRFPIVRNVFRQFRSDARYHFGALRETASGIGHDVKSTIRGERAPRGTSGNQYGYRGAPQPRQPDDSAPRYQDYYEEPVPPRYPANPPQTPYQSGMLQRAPTGPAPSPANPAPQSQEDPLTEVPELERLPDPDQPQPDADPRTSEREPSDPSKKSRSTTEKQPETTSKPIVGKRVYPEAKRSNRPGFHYSPYAPYELLDTQGIEPGGLAKDPGNGNIFRLPK